MVRNEAERKESEAESERLLQQVQQQFGQSADFIDKNERGEMAGAINCFEDITEWKRAERKLRESEERYRQLVEQCRLLHPDLVITDSKMPDMDGIDAAGEIYKDAPIPVILVSTDHNRESIERATVNHVLAYLVKPIEETDLGPAIGIAMKRFEEFQALRQEAAGLRQALEDRKAIERAKGIIMRRGKLKEAEAFRRLQRFASDKGRKLVEIAQMIVAAEEAFQAVEKSGAG